jgi:hypothetical protein
MDPQLTSTRFAAMMTQHRPAGFLDSLSVWSGLWMCCFGADDAAREESTNKFLD